MARVRLISAEEALADAQGIDGFEKHRDGMGEIHYSDQPSPDYERAAPYQLARAQLDLMVDLLRDATGVPRPLVLTEQTICGLRHLAYGPRDTIEPDYDLWDGDPSSRRNDDRLPPEIDPATGQVRDGYWDFELAAVRDGLMLRRALERVGGISYAFAVDGSVSFELGPEYPEAAATLGLRGNYSGELDEDPKLVFEAAVRAMRCAAEILGRSRYRG